MDMTTSKGLKQLRPHFVSECIVSPSWIACALFAIRRAANDKRAKEVVFASLEVPEHCQFAKTDDEMHAILFGKLRPVEYRWTVVLVDVRHLGMARLFVAEDGQTAAINERYVKLFDLRTVRGAQAENGTGNANSLRIARGGLATVDDAGEAQVIVMPVRLLDAYADLLRKFDMRLCADEEVRS